jgi:hypothetical protein
MNPPKLLSLCVCLALFLVATASPLAAQPQPPAQAVLDASKDAVWDATIAALTDSGYRIRDKHRDSGTIAARRTRSVGRLNEQEATQELRQITRAEPRRGVIDARGMSEYHVNLNTRISPSDGKTEISVTGTITAVYRRRGRAGAPVPLGLNSSGFLEQELVQRVQDRLAHGAPTPTPAQP